VEVNIDSYFDHRTAFSFTASVSGVRGDEFISNDGSDWDSNWDPIWESAASIDERGWTAEVRIPLSQLRYGDKEEQVWGIQVQRRVFREEERSLWQPKSKDEVGWVSRFGELRGIRGIRAQRQVELLPYGVARGELYEEEAGNPFADGSEGKLSGGLDGKIGVTGDLTLDFTVNPDFGQVEADPSEVNLSAFETFFQERRPFFIEGSNILDLQIAPAVTGGGFTRDNLFYSRRIGRRPHGWPSLASEEHADLPDNSTILGAFKLTGKTKRGLSIGVMESVTAEEKATVDGPAGRREETVEPLTNYFAGRLQQDFRHGDTRLGAMLTAVNRRIDEPALAFLHEGAFAGGLDFFHFWYDRCFYTALNVLGSQVKGDQEAILATQTAPARYYQRPDNAQESVDSTRTSLAGHAGSLRLGKAGGNFHMETGVAWRSPGFEINDLGYMRQADQINQFTWAGYNIRDPFLIFRRASFNTNQWTNWDFGGEDLSKAFNANTHMTFRNNSNLGGGVTRSQGGISNTALRGGPSMMIEGDWDTNWYFNSDHRSTLTYGGGFWTGRGDEDSWDGRSFWVHMSYRPNNALRLSVNPSWSKSRSDLQYVGTDVFGGEDRYLFGRMDQKTVSFTFRADYAVTPNLSIQYYGMPFVSAGRYSEFKRVTDPRATEYRDRFHVFAADEIAYDAGEDAYFVDEDTDGTDDYLIYDPDFNYREFNSNFVLRWEYQPGSILYLVWSQSRFGFVGDGRFSYRDDLRDLFDVHPHDVFLIKISKWLSL